MSEPINGERLWKQLQALCERQGLGKPIHVPDFEERISKALTPSVTVGEAISASNFLTEVCEDLFGCHVSPGFDEDMARVFKCATCERTIDIKNWVHAEHAEDCIINRVRDYLAVHKPECVTSHGVPFAPSPPLAREPE